MQAKANHRNFCGLGGAKVALYPPTTAAYADAVHRPEFGPLGGSSERPWLGEGAARRGRFRAPTRPPSGTCYEAARRASKAEHSKSY